jgi:malate synthase
MGTTAAPTSIERADEILTDDALAFVTELERRFRPRRDELLAERRRRAELIARSGRLGFLEETKHIRDDDWTVPPAPADLVDRRVEITGPTDRKLAINALNSGARVWLADFEDANAPTWANVVQGQVNLTDAIAGDISLTSPDGREYRLDPSIRQATIVVRPRGWHLDESHLLVDDVPVSAAFVDFGLYVFHNARRLLGRGSGPYFYLPKIESHLEARLWDEVFTFAEGALGLPHGIVRSTVLIETITAAFEMDEILYELRDHASGLNAGRWDYLFSIIKRFGVMGPEFVLPDRNRVTMTAPFMRAYTDLLVRTCHRRGAHAIGGMAAFIPNRRSPAVTEAALAKVREDKEREVGDGFDGSWVAHPDLVPVCRKAFDAVLGDRPHQIDRRREDVRNDPAPLLDIGSAPGSATMEGLRNDVAVALRYLEAWLRGHGAVAIFDLMEDAATAEIARSQIWQWLHHGVRLTTGETVTAELVGKLADAELEQVRSEVGAVAFDAGRWNDARHVFDRLVLAEDLPEFLTIEAYDLLEAGIE